MRPVEQGDKFLGTLWGGLRMRLENSSRTPNMFVRGISYEVKLVSISN